MDDRDAILLLQWIFGGIGTVALVLFGIWWKIEARQDAKIDKLQSCNHKDHQAIRQELVETKDQMTQQHMHLRDKIEKIWQHLVKESE